MRRGRGRATQQAQATCRAARVLPSPLRNVRRESGWAPGRQPPSRRRQPIPMLYLDRCTREAKLARSRDVSLGQGSTSVSRTLSYPLADRASVWCDLGVYERGAGGSEPNGGGDPCTRASAPTLATEAWPTRSPNTTTTFSNSSGASGFKAYYLVRGVDATTSISEFDEQSGAEENRAAATLAGGTYLPDGGAASPQATAGEVRRLLGARPSLNGRRGGAPPKQFPGRRPPTILCARDSHEWIRANTESPDRGKT